MSIEKVKEYLEQFEAADRVMEFDASSATVDLAAEALHVDGARICKTLSFRNKEEGAIVVQMAGAIVLVLLDEGPLHQFLLTLDFQLTGVAAVHFTMVALLLLTVLYGAIFYIVTTITLKKRLNLE